ncbi:Melibiose/raffinose/stachyose import permease protein MelD [Paenibacillus allorhizoplanae]|uniref:Melibiose/raffinose/stachyose import permease protein MelD n=1 Tax=Paenibacillus allorhizoplanae TaxID=2905648 RepID=A0ABN8GYU4_9BACL|nr:sugar ABC transporter permease [Paenibacillus allorhizoplanae]CAH1221240.1 Melibiose/raffinose/stachyose import permease protein MelD [Paenibacillus allorhizoplanae]
MRSKGSLNLKTFWIGILFLLPISIMIVTFMLVPVFQTMYYSFTNWDGLGEYRFIGFRNYQRIFSDASFVRTMYRTLWMGVAIALLTNAIGMLLALAVNQAFKTKNVMRTLFYFPKLLPIVLGAYVWGYILDTNNGLMNKILSSLMGKPIKVLWVDSPDFVAYTIILVAVWQLTGPIMIVYLAALQFVPNEIKEAAIMDGASPSRKFFSIILPMIAPGITVNTLIGLASGLKLFDLPFALTGGGPARASETLAIRIYRNAFQSLDLAYGMAAACVLVIFVLAITLLFVVVTKKYEGRAYE